MYGISGHCITRLHTLNILSKSQAPTTKMRMATLKLGLSGHYSHIRINLHQIEYQTECGE